MKPGASRTIPKSKNFWRERKCSIIGLQYRLEIPIDIKKRPESSFVLGNCNKIIANPQVWPECKWTASFSQKARPTCTVPISTKILSLLMRNMKGFSAFSCFAKFPSLGDQFNRSCIGRILTPNRTLLHLKWKSGVHWSNMLAVGDLELVDSTFSADGIAHTWPYSRGRDTKKQNRNLQKKIGRKEKNDKKKMEQYKSEPIQRTKGRIPW